MSTVAVRVDLRGSFGPARDQGPRPTCLAFAASDMHAGLRAGWVPLSCEYAFYNAQRRAGLPPTEGALLSAMLESIREDGQPEEAAWPYLPKTPSDTSKWVPPSRIGPLFARAGLKTVASVQTVIDELDAGHPSILLLKLSAAFYQPSAQGVVHPTVGERPQPERRHAVVAVGHGQVDSHRAVLVRNSWGERWGVAGYGWLTEPFLGPRLFATAKLMEEINVSATIATT